MSSGNWSYSPPGMKRCGRKASGSRYWWWMPCRADDGGWHEGRRLVKSDGAGKGWRLSVLVVDALRPGRSRIRGAAAEWSRVLRAAAGRGAAG